MRTFEGFGTSTTNV